MYRSFATSLLISFLLLAAHATPASAISISYNTEEGGKAVSSWQNFNLDDAAFLSEATILDSGKLYQTRQAAGSGSNSIKQLLSGNGYTVENTIDSVGALSVASSAAASPESADLSQEVSGTGELSASIQGTQGTDSAGQEASVLGGVLSSSQSLSASAGDGVSAAQATEMAGIIGRVSSGAISEEKAMITSGSFLGAGTLEAVMSSQSKGQSQASMAVDGVEWMKQSDLDKVSQEGVGMAVEGLRFDRLGDLGSFSMQAASLDRADYEIDKADRAENAASSDKSSEEDGVSSAVMYLNNPNAYILTGWKWTQNNPQIKMYLKKDANFNNEGLDAVATKNAIEAAANTWDDAVAQNLFADSNLVTVTEASNINTDTKDGYNTHGWKPITEGLAFSRTYFSTAKVGGYYPALESDVTYDSDYQWATDGRDIDVQSVALHEMGHTIGLGDLYGKPEYEGDTDEVMHYYDAPQHTLGVGDVNGVQSLYGSPLDRVFMIMAKHSGKYLDIYAGLKDNGARAIQWPAHGGDNQRFILRPVVGDDGYYSIVALHSAKYLDVYGGRFDDGAEIIQWSAHSGNNQRFMFKPVVGEEGYYNIVAKHSGKYIDIYGGSTDSGAKAIQWPSHGGDNQKFKLIAI